jgi:hypothetical protein
MYRNGKQAPNRYNSVKKREDGTNGSRRGEEEQKEIKGRKY